MTDKLHVLQLPATAITATDISTNVIDLGQLKNAWDGTLGSQTIYSIYLNIVVGAVGTGAGTIAIGLTNSSEVALTGGTTITLPIKAATAGTGYAANSVVFSGTIGIPLTQRYLGLTYTASGTVSITISASLEGPKAR